MILKKNLENFEKKINFKFSNINILINSLIHPSYLKDKKNHISDFKSDFERLEFLGDRVLGLVISSLIYEKFENLEEGDLTKKLSYLVQKDFLYKIALEIKIDSLLKYSSSKENTRMKKSILSDSVESLIGAVYIDGGYLSSLNFIKNIWGPYLDINASNKQDPKTHLQELLQNKNMNLPIYNLIKKEGPPHAPSFTVSLQVFDFKLIEGLGKSKREAEKNAAIKALELINE